MTDIDALTAQIALEEKHHGRGGDPLDREGLRTSSNPGMVPQRRPRRRARQRHGSGPAPT